MRTTPIGVEPGPLVYSRHLGVDAFLRLVREASSLQIIEMERVGINTSFIKDLALRMNLPSSRVLLMLNIPKASRTRKASSNNKIDGQAGQAAVGVMKLLLEAQRIVDESTAPEAESFDTMAWFGRWIEQPQPALGGRKPSDFVDTPTGIDLVFRLLGSLQSGAFQ